MHCCTKMYLIKIFPFYRGVNIWRNLIQSVAWIDENLSSTKPGLFKLECTWNGGRTLHCFLRPFSKETGYNEITFCSGQNPKCWLHYGWLLFFLYTTLRLIQQMWECTKCWRFNLLKGCVNVWNPHTNYNTRNKGIFGLW